MKKIYAYLSVSLLSLASLSSCSRSDYSFKTTGNPYHTVVAKPAVVSTENSAVEAGSATELFAAFDNTPVLLDNATSKVAQALATTPAAKGHTLELVTKTASVAEYKAERKAVNTTAKQLKKSRNVASADEQPPAEGKSQLVALLLAFFVGGLGIHRFYLGYTGIGIAQILTLGGCGIWSLIDFIRIITGDLKPKGADYETKL